MKKFLSLVLALVMTMSLVTVSAGAVDFTDDSDIDYKEAVDVISALGIVDGYSDDSFRPDGSLTRGAAAKIICNLILGPTTASALSATTAPFRDVPTTNTFAGYITYCSQQGIISGYGDGTFRPTGTLTGNAFMKMLLGALGYDSSVEGYTGANWTVNVIKQAVGIGLDDGNDDFVGSRTVTRQEAALYAFNMLQATMVEYDSKSVVVVGDVEINTIPTRYEAANTSTRTDGNIKDDGLMQFAERYFTDLKATADEDAFSRPATTWRYDNRLVGTYTNEADLTYTTSVEYGDIYSDLGLTETTKTTGFYVDGEDKTDFNVARRDDTKLAESGNGVLTQVWYEEDERGNVEDFIVSCVNTYVAEITSINNANDEDRSVTLTPKGNGAGAVAPGTLANSGRFETENFSRDDLVTYTAAYVGNGRYEIQTVELLEDYETGVLTEWNGNNYTTTTVGKNNFTVGGVTYDYSAKFTAEDEDGDATDIWQFTEDESELNVYCDQYGYAIFVSGVEGSKNYAAVIGVGSSNNYGSSTTGVTLLLADGSTVEVTAELADNSKALSTNGGSSQTVKDFIGDLVSYTVGDNNVYELTVLDKYHTKGGGYSQATFENGKSELVVNGRTYYTANDTIFFVATGTNGTDVDYDVYVGYDAMPSFITTGAGYKGVTGYAAYGGVNGERIDLVYIAANELGDTSAADVYFVKEMDAHITHNSRGDYYTLPAIVDGAETEVRIDASTLDAKVGPNATTEGLWAINHVREDSNGIITGFDFVNPDVSTATGTESASRGLLKIGNAYYAYNEDTVVYYVAEDYKDISVSSISAIAKDDYNKISGNLDNDGRYLTEVFVVEVDDNTPVTPPAGKTQTVAANWNVTVNGVVIAQPSVAYRSANSGIDADALAAAVANAQILSLGDLASQTSGSSYTIVAENAASSKTIGVYTSASAVTGTPVTKLGTGYTASLRAGQVVVIADVDGTGVHYYQAYMITD